MAMARMVSVCVLLVVLVLRLACGSLSSREPFEGFETHWYAYTSSDVLKLDADPGLDVFDFLFGPELSVEQFLQASWEKQWIHISRNDTGYFGQLFPLVVLDAILDTSLACMDGFKVVQDTPETGIEYALMQYPDDVFLVKRTEADGELWSGILQLPPGVSFSSAFARSSFSRGYSLVLNRLNCRWKLVQKFTEQLMKQCFGYRTNINLYFTPANSQGFEAHFDWMESIVMQLQGSKKWKLYEHNSNASILLTYPSLKFKPKAKFLERHSTITMNPGDVLYFPRGIAHEASTEGLDETSMHLTIGIEIDPLYTWMGFFFISVKHIEKVYRPVWAQSHEFVNFLILDAALDPENWFMRRAVPFGEWINSPRAGRHEFHGLILRLTERLMDAIDYKRAKRRLADPVSILPHFHESFEVYFHQIIQGLKENRSMRLGKKDLLDVVQFLQDFQLVESAMNEFVATIKQAKKASIYKDRSQANINYRRLTDALLPIPPRPSRHAEDRAQKDEL